MVTRSYPVLRQFLDELGESCVLLARHGETDWNERKIIQGQQDRPLTRKGFEQRKNLFFLLNPVPLERIVCSTLQRTIQTASPLSVEKDIPLEKVAELNEVKLGIFEGQHKEEFSDDVSRDCYRDFLADEVNVVLPGGGESLVMVDERVRPVIEELRARVVRRGHALLVGHRNVNKMVVKTLLRLTLEQGFRVEHMNDWLYVYAPKRAEIFLLTVPPPGTPIRVQEGIANVALVSR